MRIENTWQEIRDHSFIQNHSRSFRFTDPWRCFFSSVNSCSSGFRSENSCSSGFRSENSCSSGFRSENSCSSGFRSENSCSSGFRSENSCSSGFRSENSCSSGFRSENSCSSGFRSENSCSSGFRSEDRNGRRRSLVLCSLTHFYVFFEVWCLGGYWTLKIQTWPIIRFLTESVTYWFVYLLVFDQIHDAMCLNNVQDLQQKYSPTTSKIQQYISLYTWATFHPCVH